MAMGADYIFELISIKTCAPQFKWLNKSFLGSVMCADSLAENTQMLPQNLSAQAQKFWISMKIGFIGRP